MLSTTLKRIKFLKQEEVRKGLLSSLVIFKREKEDNEWDSTCILEEMRGLLTEGSSVVSGTQLGVTVSVFEKAPMGLSFEMHKLKLKKGMPMFCS